MMPFGLSFPSAWPSARVAVIGVDSVKGLRQNPNRGRLVSLRLYILMMVMVFPFSLWPRAYSRLPLSRQWLR